KLREISHGGEVRVSGQEVPAETVGQGRVEQFNRASGVAWFQGRSAGEGPGELEAKGRRRPQAECLLGVPQRLLTASGAGEEDGTPGQDGDRSWRDLQGLVQALDRAGLASRGPRQDMRGIPE